MRLVPRLVAVGALALVLTATHRHGLGLSLDSVVYARAAKSLVERGTLDVPLTPWDEEASEVALSHFPPALPLVLAGIGEWTEADPYAAACWLNAACVFGTVLLALVPIADSIFAVLVMVALLAGPSFATMYLWLWSEPLFLLLALAALRLGVKAQRCGATTARLLSLGIVCGLATMTRYAGAALFMGFASLLLFSGESSQRRYEQALTYGAAYVATVSPWIWWLSTAAGAPRSLGLYPLHAWSEIVLPMTRAIVTWFLPAALPLAVAVVGLVLLLVVSSRAYHRHLRSTGDDRAGATVCASAALIGVYVAFLLGARVFADPGIPLNERTLSPVLLFFAVAASDVARTVCRGRLPVLPTVLIVCVMLGNVTATVPHVARVSREGLGYSSEAWARSETLAWLRNGASDLTIFSNAPDIICAHLPVTAKYTPEHYETDRLADFASRIERAAPAAVVLFDDPHPDWLLSRDLLRSPPFPHDRRVFSDGVVLLTRRRKGLT